MVSTLVLYHNWLEQLSASGLSCSLPASLEFCAFSFAFPPKLVGRLMWFGLIGLDTNSDSIVGVDDLLFLLATFGRSLTDDYGCDAGTAGGGR